MQPLMSPKTHVVRLGFKWSRGQLYTLIAQVKLETSEDLILQVASLDLHLMSTKNTKIHCSVFRTITPKTNTRGTQSAF